MLKELLNSKMFWLLLAAISGLLLGSLTQRLAKSKQRFTALAIPFIALFLTMLILKFVKLNVAYFDIKYTIAGIGMMILVSLFLAYISFLSYNKKISYFNNFTFLYLGLSMVIFYVFYKSELKITTNECPETKDIYLLLKKEDADYFEINPEGIGYIGAQLYSDGFRPYFEYKANEIMSYSHIPVAVEINTSYGVAHALVFKSDKGDHLFNLDELIKKGVVKAEELKWGDLKQKQ